MAFFSIILKLKIIIIIFSVAPWKLAEGLNFMLRKSIWWFYTFFVVYFKIFRALEQIVPADAYELMRYNAKNFRMQFCVHSRSSYITYAVEQIINAVICETCLLG